VLEIVLIFAPELLRDGADRQLAQVAAIGAHTALARPTGRTAGELTGLEQRHRPAGSCKLIGEARAIDAAANNDDFGCVAMIGHRSIPFVASVVGV
jgi:hypothetical protein